MCLKYKERVGGLLLWETNHESPSNTMEVEEGALRLVRDAFGDKDFYEILNIKKSATEKEIKRAYRKLALKCVRCLIFD